MVIAASPNRITLIDPDESEVQVIEQHITRRRIVADVWPKTDLLLFPTCRRVAVLTPGGIRQAVVVRLRIVGAFVHAVADPDGRLAGSCPDASAVFDLASELAAERQALGMV